MRFDYRVVFTHEEDKKNKELFCNQYEVAEATFWGIIKSNQETAGNWSCVCIGKRPDGQEQTLYKFDKTL